MARTGHTGALPWVPVVGALILGALLAPARVQADPYLSLAPKVCVLARGETLCQDNVNIAWHSAQPLTLCLFVDDDESRSEPLRCWQDQNNGAHEFRAETAESLLFQLRQQHTGVLLASEVFTVIREHTEYRQRRRNPWSFF